METAEVLAARLRSNPADLEAYESLKALYRSHGDVASLVNLIAGWAGWVPDDAAASAAYLEVADLLAHEVGDPAQAEAYYLEATRRDPLNTAASDAIEALWEAHGQFPKLAEFLQDQVQVLARLGAGPKQLAVRRYRLGELWSKQFGRSPEALHHYRKAFDLDPSLLRAMYEARQLYLADGDLRAAAELYDREAAAEVNPERRIALLLELAALYRDELNDYDGAVSALQRAHGTMPADASLAYELATLLIQRAERVDARTAQGDYALMADLMCGVASAVDPEHAASYLETALDYAPDHERALSELERVLGPNADATRLAKRWVAYLALAPDGRGAGRRRTALAHAYAQEGQIDDAIYCLEPAVESGYQPAAALLAELRKQATASDAEPMPAFDDADLEPLEPEGFEVLEEAPAGLAPKPELRDTARPRGRVNAGLRATTDFGDIQTQVGEPELIDSLREATVEQPLDLSEGDPDTGAESRASSIPPERHTRETLPSRPAASTQAARAAAAIPMPAPAPEPGPEAEDAGFEDLSSLDELDELDEALSAQPTPGTLAAELAHLEAPPPRAGAVPSTAAEPERQMPAVHEPVHEPEPEPRHTQPTREPFPIPEPSEAETKALRASAAQLAREQHHEEAAAAYEQVLLAEPRDREAFAFLDAFYRRTQHYARRAALLEETAIAAGLPAHVRITRLREAAGTYEARLKDYPAALRCFRLLADLEPGNEDVLRAQKRLLERAQLWDELALVLEAEVSRAPDADPKLPLLRKLAALHRDKRGDRDAAADVLERMLMLRPDDRATREALIEDLLAAGRDEDALPLIERKVEEAASRSQKLALLEQLARLCEERLGDRNRAFGMYERMLALTPGDTATFAQLERIDEQSGNYARLLDTLERRVASVSGAEAATLLMRMSQIAEGKLSDRERAGELLARAVDLAPEQPEPLQALCDLYQRGERYDDLVELLRERALIERSVAARVELHRRIARVLGERLNDADGAIDAWQKLLQLQEDREALQALQQRARERDDAEQLAQVLGRLSAIEPSAEAQRDLLFERASLLVRRLNQPAQAIGDLVRVLTMLDPSFEAAFEELEAASATASDYGGLSQVLEARLAGAQTPDAQIEQARRLADLYEHKLVDAERATRALGRWALADAQNPEPFDRLVPLLTRARRHAELLNTLDALTLIAHTPEARQRATIGAAELASSKLKDVDGAWHRLQPLVEAGVGEAVDALIALAQSAKRFAPLYDLLEGAGQITKLLSLLRARTARDQDPVIRASLLRRTAQVLIDYAQDEDGAAEAYRRLLEIEEDADALRFLQSVALRKDDPETLADVLKRLAALERNDGERRDLLFEHARVLHARLARPAQAVPVLRQVLAEDPEYEAAYDELARASEAAADYTTLAATLDQMFARSADSVTRIALASRLADVCERELHDAPRAIDALLRFSSVDPQNPEPHRRLHPLLRAAGRDHELLASLDALSHLEPGLAAQIEATLAAAELARTRLDDVEGAWHRLVPLLPEAHPKADRALHSLAVLTQRLDALYAELERVNRHDTLALWLRERIGAEPDPRVRAALFRRMARTLAGPLDDDRGAEDAWSQLLSLEEDAEALSFLRAQALQRDDVELLGNCLPRMAALEQDRAEKRDLLYEYGHLLRARLARPAQAISVLREVIERLDPEFEPALDELIEACEAVSDQPTLAWGLERALSREHDPERQTELARKLADLCETALHQRERAIGALRVWTAAAPGDAEPHRRLVGLLTGQGRDAELLAELDALADIDDPERSAEARLRAAGLAFDQLKDADGAWQRLLPLANIGNERAEALLARLAFEAGKTQELIGLYQAADRYDDLITVLRDQAERATDPHARVELYRRCARLLKGPLGDELAAAEAYRELLEISEDVEALTFLRVQALRMDDAAELADMAGRLARLTAEPEQKRDLLFERALLLGDRLERPAQALEVLRAIVLELDPRFTPAIEELVALAETSDDYANLALGLECQLALASHADVRAEVAERLTDLYEDKLKDSAKAMAALTAWSASAPRNSEPLRRLRPLLEQAHKPRELLAVLDALAACEASAEPRIEAALSAAALLVGELKDPEGGWQRLSALVLAREPRAERAAQELCERAGMFRPLANAYVVRAQAESPELARGDWMQAAAIYERNLAEPGEALEAMLRALALDMQNRELLSKIDRLAADTGAWDRLARVYAKLAQQAGGNDEKVELLARHAALLERHTSEPAVALERLLEVCKLAPDRKDLLERAEALAIRAGTHAELIWIYETLARHAADDELRVHELVRAARVADLELKDREHALRDMTRALALTQNSARAAAEIEELARELDRERPELGQADARRALVRAHLELGQQVGLPFGPVLVLRAARFLASELRDDSASFDALKQGATLFPQSLELYDALEQAAIKIKRLDALDAHLARSVQSTSDVALKRALLQRRGSFLAIHLGRHAKAADAYRELLVIDPDNGHAFDALRESLRQAARYQDLLKLYTDRLARTQELPHRLMLMREMAKLWEVELKNRPSAIELWQSVKGLAPEDEEAGAALSRLQR
jgi:tetratricopeptide (TPR) repeat protein